VSDKNRPDEGPSQAALLVIGIVLVVLGLGLAGERLLPGVFAPLRVVLSTLRTLWWPMLIIGAGVLVLLAANRDRDGATAPRTGRLYRSRSDKMIAGVLGGVGAYLGIDPTWLRIGVVLLAVVTWGWGMIIAYAVAAAVIPEEPVSPPVGSNVAPPPPIPPASGPLA